jgi:homoserine dehydrogenase
MREIRYVLVGLGNLGRRFCEVVQQREELLGQRYGLALKLVGAADSRGAAYDPGGLDLGTVVRLKAGGDTIGHYPDAGRVGWGALALVEAAEADLLLEASPVNLEQGAEPGLSCIRAAMNKGMHVVTPNKGPMVAAFQELHALAKAQGVELRYDGTVAGGLPALNVGCRDLRGARVRMIEAVPNLVTGFIMDMLADGIAWEEATSTARDAGVLEADASWDLDGWDAAAKLVILTNAVLGADAHLEDVARTGIGAVGVEELQAAVGRGERYRLVARTELQHDGSYTLSVAPVPLPSTHSLGRLGRKQMGVVYTTDIYGTITLIIDEPDPIPSSATMLRDLLDIYAGEITAGDR